MKFIWRVALMLLTAGAAVGQQSRWAATDDATAKYMIDSERQWAEAQCTHSKIAEKILADDFEGTSPEATRYTKAEEVKDTTDPAKAAKDCKILDTPKVRFFGDNLALVFGSESSVRDGKSRCLIWTDTWLKRGGEWQIIAAQDTQYPCK